MVISTRQVVPTAVVVGVILYWVWPCLLPDSTGAPAPAKLLEIATSQLSPMIEPPPQRDPFQAAAAVSATRPAGPVPPPLRNPIQTAAAVLPTQLAALVSSGKEAPNKASQSSTNGGLVLQATSAHGDHRLAIINGCLYAEGDTLQGPAAGDTPPVITRILPYLVLLEQQGRIVELKYSDPSAGRALGPASRAAAPARGSATSRSRAKKPGPGPGRTTKKIGPTA